MDGLIDCLMDGFYRSICRWDLLREVCFEPPVLELAEALRRLKGKKEGFYIKGSLDKAACRLRHLDIQLSRHPNGADFLTAPLYPYDAATADISEITNCCCCCSVREAKDIGDYGLGFSRLCLLLSLPVSVWEISQDGGETERER